jgi:hypothetical protein
MMRKVAGYLPSFLEGVSRGIKNSVPAVPDTLGAVAAKVPVPTSSLNPAPPWAASAVIPKSDQTYRDLLRLAATRDVVDKKPPQSDLRTRLKEVISGASVNLRNGLKNLRNRLPGAPAPASAAPANATQPVAGVGSASGR